MSLLFNYFDSLMAQERITENEDNFVMELAQPGKTLKDFKIEVEKSKLTIEVESSKDDFFPTYKRSYKLPESVDKENISAIYKAGILVITIPKSEESRKNKIVIEVKGE